MTTAQPEVERPHGGSLQYEISNALVGLLREYTGRGPTKARTTIRDNVIVVTLTKGEQVLVGKGRSGQVLALRHEYQEAMREESSAKVAELTGRNVVAFLSANHVDPDLAAEIYVLDGPPNHSAETQSRLLAMALVRRANTVRTPIGIDMAAKAMDIYRNEPFGGYDVGMFA